MRYLVLIFVLLFVGCNIGTGTLSYNFAGSQITERGEGSVLDSDATDGGLLDGGQVEADPTSPQEADSQNSE